MDVSENSGTPKSSISIGFSIIFTIHVGVPLFLETPIYIYIYTHDMDDPPIQPLTGGSKTHRSRLRVVAIRISILTSEKKSVLAQGGPFLHPRN